MDSVNFALGLHRFSPELHQPQPPGYFLYIQLGRLAQLIFPEPNSALLFISILSSVLLVIIVYELALTWFGRNEACISGLLFVFSPLAWFHGVVALSYILEACITGLFGLLCWHLYKGRNSLVVPAAIIFGLAVGVRQTAVIFFAPLWLFSLQHVGWSKRLLALCTFTITVAVWFFPMVWASGGSEVYFTAFSDLVNRVSPSVSESTKLSTALKSIGLRTLLFLNFYSICFVAAAPLLFLKNLHIPLKLGIRPFLAVWLAPGLFFFIFIYFNPNNLGHLLFLAVPLFAVLGAKGFVWFEQAAHSKQVKSLIVSMFAIVNVCFFLFAPTYISYRSVKKFEHTLVSIQGELRKIANPKDTVIVAMDSHWLGFRHAGYYLPEYVILQYPEMQFTSGIKDFVMYDRGTILIKTIPVSQYRKFVIFPYHSSFDQAYIKNFFEKFPKGALVKESFEGYTYVTGQVTDLGLIFPMTAK